MTALGDRWTEARLALSLLTRLPAGPFPDQPIPTGNTAWAFPLVGLLVGLLSGLVYLTTATALPPMIAAILAVGAAVLLTGALHEDGLADVADGFGGGQDRAAKLDIMRDSRIGTYGVVALILALGVIISAVAEMPRTAASLPIFAAIGAMSRSAMLVPMALLPPARTDGLGQSATLPIGLRFWTGLGLGIIAALLTLPILVLVVASTTLALLWLAKRQIGGQTGDVLGATQKLAECAAWATAATYVSAS